MQLDWTALGRAVLQVRTNRLASSRWSSTVRLAWSLWALTGAFVIGYLLLKVTISVVATAPLMTIPSQLADTLKPSIAEYAAAVLSRLALLGFSTLGALIVVRHPKNPMGWIFCMVA